MIPEMRWLRGKWRGRGSVSVLKVDIQGEGQRKEEMGFLEEWHKRESRRIDELTKMLMNQSFRLSE
jgi:hypothetical protein